MSKSLSFRGRRRPQADLVLRWSTGNAAEGEIPIDNDIGHGVTGCDIRDSAIPEIVLYADSRLASQLPISIGVIKETAIDSWLAIVTTVGGCIVNIGGSAVGRLEQPSSGVEGEMLTLYPVVMAACCIIFGPETQIRQPVS